MIRLTVPEIGEDDIQAVVEVLRSGYLVQGHNVRAFEASIAAYLQVKHAVAVSSGTAALHLAVLAAGIGPGDEVLVPDFTFPATANVVAAVGAIPILVDIDLRTFNLDATQMTAAITSRTKAVIPVHVFGQPADMQPIAEVAAARHLLIIEDAACALGAEYHGRKCGTLGLMGCFSFHPRKAITTGEGGMIVTNDAVLADQLREWRNHGMAVIDGQTRFVRAGLNYRLTDFQGALGLAQMRRFEQMLAQRNELAEYYHRALADIPALTPPTALPGTRHIWQSYVTLLRDDIPRDAVLAQLHAQGIEAGIGTYALSAQPYYAAHNNAAHWPQPLPNAYRAYQQSLCLPLHSQMTRADAAFIVATLERVVQSYICV
jgi:perosamine synthetase